MGYSINKRPGSGRRICMGALLSLIVLFCAMDEKELYCGEGSKGLTGIRLENLPDFARIVFTCDQQKDTYAKPDFVGTLIGIKFPGNAASIMAPSLSKDHPLLKTIQVLPDPAGVQVQLRLTSDAVDWVSYRYDSPPRVVIYLRKGKAGARKQMDDLSPSQYLNPAKVEPSQASRPTPFGGGHPGDGYRVGPGDVLKITVRGNEDLTKEIVVSPGGSGVCPLIGEVKAGGFSVDEIGSRIMEKLADGYLVNPHVEVVVKEYRSQKVFLLGEVVHPGTYSLDNQASLIEIISKAGGLGSDAGEVVEVSRAPQQGEKDKPQTPVKGRAGDPIRVDLRRLLAGTPTEKVEIRNGDTIFVPRAKVFYIFGEVKQPGKYKWDQDLTVLKAVITAGGFTELASKRRIQIGRKDSDGEKKIAVKLDSMVEAGDTITVPESLF